MCFFQMYPGEQDFVRTGKSRSQVPSQEVSFIQKKNNSSSRPPVPLTSLSLEEKQLTIFFATNAFYPMKLSGSTFFFFFLVQVYFSKAPVYFKADFDFDFSYSFSATLLCWTEMFL